MKDRFTLRMYYDDMGSFTQPGCRDLDDALWHINSARNHDGLMPMDMDCLLSLTKGDRKGWARLTEDYCLT